MSKSAKKSKTPGKTIAVNRKATHDYHIEERFEAGIMLEGWEVKSLRAGRAQLKESYVLLKAGEAWIIGMHLSPLQTASTHITPDPVRSRKLLLSRRELNRLIGAKERKGYTIVPLSIYWKRQYVKVEIGLAKGKKLHDKRESEKRRDWDREKHRVLKHS